MALCAHKDLQPTFISDGGEGVEAITVDIHLKEISISVISAFGPQESDALEKKIMFWKYLSEQANRVKLCGNGFILQGDLNAWLGSGVIKGDSREQNRNGKLFSTFLGENNLKCVSSMDLTEGVVTRIRNCLGTLENGTIDFYVVCERVVPHVIYMKIDSDNKHTLTNFHAVKETGKATQSDHNPLLMEVQLKFPPTKKVPVKVFNFKDKHSQKIFREITSETKAFTNCFINVQLVLKQTERWINTLKTHCKKVFKIIRIRTRNIKPSGADKLITQRNKLIKQGKKDTLSLFVKIAEIISKECMQKPLMFEKYTDTNLSGAVSKI